MTPGLTLDELAERTGEPRDRLQRVLAQMETQGAVKRFGAAYRLSAAYESAHGESLRAITPRPTVGTAEPA